MPQRSAARPVLVIYTGGTMGMTPRRANDPRSPLRVGGWRELSRWIPQSTRLGFEIRHVSIRRPVDSSDVTPADWCEMAEIIAREHRGCCGVVVLHGTDTMAYTATALAFMLTHLNFPVVVTGAQLPISTPGTDAVQNLVNALRIAAGPAAGVEHVPEVCLYFRDHLLRGCRATKNSANGFDAFESPNYPLLGIVDQKTTIYEDRLRPAGKGKLRLRTGFDPGVLVLRMAPGMDVRMVRRMVLDEGVHGVVLQSFGAGNVPVSGGIAEAIGEAVEGGTVVVNVTQCPRGRVEEGMYEGSAKLRECGVIGGGGMTTEAAIIKLQMALADHRRDPGKVRKSMLADWAGERSAQ